MPNRKKEEHGKLGEKQCDYSAMTSLGYRKRNVHVATMDMFLAPY